MYTFLKGAYLEGAFSYPGKCLLTGASILLSKESLAGLLRLEYLEVDLFTGSRSSQAAKVSVTCQQMSCHVRSKQVTGVLLDIPMLNLNYW